MVFSKVKNQNFCIGTITDGYYKLNVLVFVNNENYENNFICGSEVQLIGRLRIPIDKPPYLSVSSFDNIREIEDERLDFLNVLNGYRSIP